VIRKLSATPDGLALILDRPILDELGVDEHTELEILTNGEILVVTRAGDESREQQLKGIIEKLDREYGGLFRRLAQ
jgi:hypothetical protein